MRTLLATLDACTARLQELMCWRCPCLCPLPCRSKDWGVSAWHWYLTSALPRSLLLSLPLVPLGLLLDRRTRSIILPVASPTLSLSLSHTHTHILPSKGHLHSPSRSDGTGPVHGLTAWRAQYCFCALPVAAMFLAPLPGRLLLPPPLHPSARSCCPALLQAVGYVALYSFLGHKETRFLFPVLPLFTLTAAAGLAKIWAMRCARLHPARMCPVRHVAASCSIGRGGMSGRVTSG